MLRGLTIVALTALSFLGCGGGSSSGGGGGVGAVFTPSATPGTKDVVKLVEKTKSGARVVVQAVIYGPDVTLDLYTFAFDVTMGDTSVVKFVSGSASIPAAGTALVALAGQTLQVIAQPDGTDPKHIVVGVSKLGGGSGNGVSAASAVVVQLTFQVLKVGTTTLTITGNPAATKPPQALDSGGVPIPAVVFDSVSATIQGV
jgi:hypothetical protein